MSVKTQNAWPKQRKIKKEILELIRDGYTTREIMEELGCTEVSVTRVKRSIRKGREVESGI